MVSHSPWMRLPALIAATSLIGSTTRARPGWVEVAGGIALFAAVHLDLGCDSHLACARRLPPGSGSRGVCPAQSSFALPVRHQVVSSHREEPAHEPCRDRDGS